jgi:hypothetical protein
MILYTHMLHDPHKIPEPILVVSGLTYLFPFYIAISNERVYDASTYIFLTFTTVGFHSTRNEVFFILDCAAILNFLLRTYYLSLKCSNISKTIYLTSVLYSLTSYFIGKYYNIMSFHPDWNTQMMYHSLMHVSTSYSSYVIIKEITDTYAQAGHRQHRLAIL